MPEKLEGYFGCRLSTPGREESVLDIRAPPSGVKLSNRLITSMGSALPGFPTTEDTTLLCSGPAEGSAGSPSGDLWGNSFAGKALGGDSDGDWTL